MVGTRTKVDCPNVTLGSIRTLKEESLLTRPVFWRGESRRGRNYRVLSWGSSP